MTALMPINNQFNIQRYRDSDIHWLNFEMSQEERYRLFVAGAERAVAFLSEFDFDDYVNNVRKPMQIENELAVMKPIQKHTFESSVGQCKKITTSTIHLARLSANGLFCRNNIVVFLFFKATTMFKACMKAA